MRTATHLSEEELDVGAGWSIHGLGWVGLSSVKWHCADWCWEKLIYSFIATLPFIFCQHLIVSPVLDQSGSKYLAFRSTCTHY